MKKWVWMIFAMIVRTIIIFGIFKCLRTASEFELLLQEGLSVEKHDSVMRNLNWAFIWLVILGFAEYYIGRKEE